MKRLLISISLSASLIAPAIAGDFTNCDVVEIVTAGDQNAHVALSCTVQNIPACAVASNYVGFDKSTVGGKQYLAMFVYAQASGAKVEGYVDHTSCSPWQNNVPLLVHLRTKR